MAGLRQAKFEVRSQIIWAKPTFVLGRGAYHWQHEPVWFAVRQGRAAPWYGGRAQSTVWEVPNLNAIGGSRTGANTPTGHATQKPVRVFEIPILNHTTAQDAVYDPFVGSGTTLIAVIDRIVHHATVLTTNGDSYRLKAAQRNQTAHARQKKTR